jgi:hypothetical protein
MSNPDTPSRGRPRKYFSDDEVATSSGDPSILNSNQPAEVRRYLKVLCNRAEMSPSALAKEAGLAASTLSRFINNPDFKSVISTSTLHKVEDAVWRVLVRNKQRDEWISKHKNRTFQIEPKKAEERFKNRLEQIRLESVSLSSLNAFSPIPVIGVVNAELNKAFWETTDLYFIAVPQDLRFKVQGRVGFEIGGNASLNRRFPESTILVCIEIFSLENRDFDGKVVILETPTAGEPSDLEEEQEYGDIRLLARVLRWHSDGSIWLWPDSHEPQFQTPILLSEAPQFQRAYLVIGSYRPE